jgi:predicted metalloprotease with PDZ domain
LAAFVRLLPGVRSDLAGRRHEDPRAEQWRKKSLDDFAKLFFGIDNGSYITVTYTFDDLVKSLNTVQPYDWAGFFRTRVYEVSPNVPENGFTQGGYRLVYNDHEPEWLKEGRDRSRSQLRYLAGLHGQIRGKFRPRFPWQP